MFFDERDGMYVHTGTQACRDYMNVYRKLILGDIYRQYTTI